MCYFFSFVTDPVNHPAEYYYFDWQYRKANLEADDADSHSHICAHFKLDEDMCNKYEFNPLTNVFEIDQINSKRDDSESAEKWARRLNFKEIVEPLVVKPVVNSLELPMVEHPTEEQIELLKEWTSVLDSVRTSVLDSVRDSVRTSVLDSVRALVLDSVWRSVLDSVENSVWTSVWDSVRDSVGNSVWRSVRTSVLDSVRDSVRTSVLDSVRALVLDSVWRSVGALVLDSVWRSVGASAWAYFSTFFDVEYKVDFSSAIKLWESGLVPSFDGTIWRLHSGKSADIVCEWTPEGEEE